MAPPQSRFATLARLPARLLLAALALLIAFGVATTLAPAPGPKLVAASRSDTALYRAIVDETAAHGATPAAYYRVAAAEQRARGYPLRPFVTMREPALALFTARAGRDATAWLYRLVALLATGTLVWRLQDASARAERLGSALCATLSVLVLAQPVMATWHEAWAAMLLVPALACAGRPRWWLGCLAALVAVLVRELAAPVLVALLFAALAERRRAEAIGWTIALALACVALAIHAGQVIAVTQAGDLVSPGWATLGGWRFILSMAGNASALSLLPGWGCAIAVPLALFGWAGRGGVFADRVTLALAALIVPFMMIGRPDNFYWGLLIAPLLPIGLAFAPRALRDLLRSARQARTPASWNAAWTADASS